MSPERLAAFDAALCGGGPAAAVAELERALATAGLRTAPAQLLEPDRNRALIQACFHRGRPDRALAYLALLSADVAPWPAVMKEANRRGDVDTLRRVLAARQAAGLRPDHRITSAAITGYAGVGRLQEALATFCRAWEARECRTVEVCNAAISACANQGNWEAAQEVLAMMRQGGIEPDAITYNCLLKAAAAAGLLGEAKRLYAEMLALRLRPSTFTYVGLFKAAANARAGDAAWLLNTFDDMASRGVQPNNYVISALFAAASYVPCTADQVERLFAALALLRSCGPPNDTVYAALLTLIQRQGIQERAVDVWTAVKQDRVRKSPHLFSSLFAACTAGASPALMDTALEAAEEMQALWRQQVDRGLRSPRDEHDMRFAYNALLHFLGCAGALQRSLAVYRGMARYGPAPDVVSYNTLISAAAAGGNVKVAMHIFSDMVDADIEPTERTCGALLNCYAKARDAASARKVFDSMASLGIRANLEIYTSLIDACVQAGGRQWTQLAFDLFDQMRAQGLSPSAVTYGCLLSACERTGEVDLGFELYKQACDEGVVPSDQMHDMLIGMCTEAQRLEEAVDLVKRLARQPRPASASIVGAGAGGAGAAAGGAGSVATGGAGGAGVVGGGGGAVSGLQEHTLNSLIRALCSKYIDRALRMLSLCQAMGMRPSRRTYLSLITGCAKGSQSSRAYDLYRTLRSQGMDADGSTASALIISLCQANQLDTAEVVYNDSLACAWRAEHAALPAPMARRGGLSNRAQLPDAEALAALVQAFAAAGDLRSAAKYYKQLRRSGRSGLAAVSVSQRRMWELLIESYCRQNKVRQALQVFDDWKSAGDAWMAAQQQHQAHDLEGTLGSGSGDDGLLGGGDAGDSGLGAAAAAPAAQLARYPKLSNVTLAFLEACCRREAEYEWRVFDVCAIMRQQKEQKRQAGLARPQKASHHFAPA
ncbi:hypothetical protein ABPG75_012500 [Micractinium tetrahymenae]